MAGLTPGRGSLWWADLDIGRKPVVVVSNDIANLALDEIIVARITSVGRDRSLPTAVQLDAGDVDLLAVTSWVLSHDLRTVPKRLLLETLGEVPEDVMVEVDRALSWSLGLEAA